jgi:hypothetical protein
VVRCWDPFPNAKLSQQQSPSLLGAFGAGHHINPRGPDVGQSKRGQAPVWGRVIWPRPSSCILPGRCCTYAPRVAARAIVSLGCIRNCVI